MSNNQIADDMHINRNSISTIMNYMMERHYVIISHKKGREAFYLATDDPIIELPSDQAPPPEVSPRREPILWAMFPHLPQPSL
ncbi:MAG: hypothetical protein KGI54_18285 [Pseudomonadota bacterium]|nr:hypothetical protein [Pseudomonadota bacterium]